jgi:hypothetical protein
MFWQYMLRTNLQRYDERQRKLTLQARRRATVTNSVEYTNSAIQPQRHVSYDEFDGLNSVREDSDDDDRLQLLTKNVCAKF